MGRPAILLYALSAMLVGGCASILSVLPGVDRLSRISGLQLTDEEQITAVLDDVHQGMEQRKIYKVLAHVSPNYYDERGRDYAALEAYLSEIFRKYRQIKITRVAPRISVFGDTARALETFGTIADPEDPAQEPPIHLQGQVTVNLEKVNGEWRIVEWGEML